MTEEQAEQLRPDFHKFLVENGFHEPRMANGGYISSHIFLLWLCYRRATQDERERQGATQ